MTGSFQSFVYVYVITVLVVLLSIVSLILIADGVCPAESIVDKINCLEIPNSSDPSG